MTGFGNAKLAGRDAIDAADLPGGGPRRAPLGFMQ
jgi:ATP-dependent Lon protease